MCLANSCSCFWIAAAFSCRSVARARRSAETVWPTEWREAVNAVRASRVRRIASGSWDWFVVAGRERIDEGDG